MTKTKQCSKCKEPKEYTEYIQNARYKDGYTNICKSCTSLYRKQYNIDKKEARAEYTKRYYAKNARRILDRNKRNQKARLATDPLYRAVENMRSRIYNVLKGTSKYAPTLELLGCTPEHFRFHIEQQFTDGMTWDNYGEWHLDHIQPCASFDQTDPEQQKQCWHYTNYQPLWAEDNMKKSDDAPDEHQVKLI